MSKNPDIPHCPNCGQVQTVKGRGMTHWYGCEEGCEERVKRLNAYAVNIKAWARITDVDATSTQTIRTILKQFERDIREEERARISQD